MICPAGRRDASSPRYWVRPDLQRGGWYVYDSVRDENSGSYVHFGTAVNNAGGLEYRWRWNPQRDGTFDRGQA